jgi:hypothetical protein
VVFDSPALALDILIDLFRSSDTRFIDAHPCRNEVAVRYLVMGENHSAKFTGFLQDIEFETSFDIFQIGGSVG